MNISEQNDSQIIFNSSDLATCEIFQVFDTFHDFFLCYQYFAQNSLIKVILQVILFTGTAFFNFFVMFRMITHTNKLTVFDQILVGHALVDGITGVIDIPFYHITDMFGYWPFLRIFSLLWSSYDNNINITTACHMLYACYARYRSIVAPVGYTNDLIMKRPWLTMMFIWTLGLGSWIPIVFSFGVEDFTLSVNFKPIWANSLLNFFSWMLPMLGILYYSIVIFVLLHQRDKKKTGKMTRNSTTLASHKGKSHGMEMSVNSAVTNKTNESATIGFFRYIKLKHRNFRLRPQVKFVIIMGSYWIQWAPPCFLNVTAPFLGGMISPRVIYFVYWLTYTVCLTDPIVVLLFNEKVKSSSGTIKVK